MNHTPGPWAFELKKLDKTWPGLYRLDTGGILDFGCEGEEGLYIDNPYDARLMEQAPALLAACRQAAAHLESIDQNDSTAYRVLLAVIDKATNLND